MNKILRILIAFLLLANVALAQSNAGEIYGRVIDEKTGQPVDFATVTALEGGIVKGGTKTDINGNFRVKPLPPGTYTLRVTNVGYQTEEITKILVGVDKSVKQDVKIAAATKSTGPVRIKEAPRKLIDEGNPGKKSMTGEEIRNLPTLSTGDFASIQAGVNQQKAGSANLNIGGDRASGTLYMIDGMMVRGRVNLPPSTIGSLELISNGMSAKYGNATGGIVGITTKGIQQNLNVSVQAQHSIEGYNNNLISADVSGPLFSKKTATGKRPLVGFVLNAAYTYDKDGDPYYFKYYRLKPEVLKRLQQNPLVANPNGTGNLVFAADQVTKSDFERIKARENGHSRGLNYLGKLDFQPTEQIQFTLGTYLNYSDGRGFSFTNSLFSPEANSFSRGYSARGFARLTQRLGKRLDQEKQDAKKNPISNAFYSLQFTYQKDYGYNGNPEHDRNIFDYGYVGNFKSHRRGFYVLDTARGASGTIYEGQKYIGDFSDSVTFTRGGKNPIFENYNSAIFGDSRFPVFNVNNVQAYQGLRNGDAPFSVYSLWTNIGAQIGGFGYSDATQVSVNLDASFDIQQGANNPKRKDPINHNIQFGLGYDQRTSSSYSLNARSLWTLMRLLGNQHIQNLDLTNPQFIVGGQAYTEEQLIAQGIPFSQFDTLRYGRIYDATSHSRFDKELRKKLFGNERNQTIIDIDNLDPKTFSLDMFSADDLYNKGNGNFANYFGYDYLGNKVKGQPSFNDFWTKRDARGDFTRPVGSFRPIYMFGYILDKFSYKDLNFNIGLRVDRYDANQKVLKDPYSLYAVRTVGDLKNSDYKLAVNPQNTSQKAPLPSSFDKDYVMYVDNNQSAKPTVVGYRKGDIWYDPFGKEIADPTVLSGLYGGGLPIQPWLQNNKDSIKSASFNPNSSFEDYRPQIALSPRIQFTFPISDQALFYGNYDVITQNPSSSNFATPDDYFFLAERQDAIANANLRMERAINYAIGYQQKISKRAAITIEAYYRERKNQIQLQRFLLAYPITYTSVGNRDFSSTKGLTVKLDFRRTGPISMDVNYTLQFAEGSGSNTTSQASLLASGQPNLRTVFPLDFDSRHLLNVSLDYRYKYDPFSKRGLRGPKVGNIYPLENVGLNLLLRTRSGNPYTRAELATPLAGGDFNSSPIVGTINGSRLPWQSELSARLNKNFIIKRGAKQSAEGPSTSMKSPLMFDVYMYVTNLLNTRNVLAVYGYTGVGDDDGFLASPQGQQSLSLFQFQQSYSDLYNMRLASPGNFNNPRRIYVGFTFDLF